MMGRKVFYSLHYHLDATRSESIRAATTLQGNQVLPKEQWQRLSQSGGDEIQHWIDAQLRGCACTIVLIGRESRSRRWLKYEIQKSWDEGKGLLGIYIHNLEDEFGAQSIKGVNPFAIFTIRQDGKRLSDVVKTYDPPGGNAQDVAAYIVKHLPQWVEEAICIRNHYRRLRA